ncbi:hypothetical protein BH09GEM1_BH09GEM1_47230 [soil metagenome]
MRIGVIGRDPMVNNRKSNGIFTAEAAEDCIDNVNAVLCGLCGFIFGSSGFCVGDFRGI